MCHDAAWLTMQWDNLHLLYILFYFILLQIAQGQHKYIYGRIVY